MNLLKVSNHVLYFCISLYHHVQRQLYRCSIYICFESTRNIIINWINCVICIFSESSPRHWSHYVKLNLCQKSLNECKITLQYLGTVLKPLIFNLHSWQHLTINITGQLMNCIGELAEPVKMWELYSWLWHLLWDLGQVLNLSEP